MCVVFPGLGATFQTDPKQDLQIIPDPKPARTCVCVKELPFKTDVGPTTAFLSTVADTNGEQVEIEVIAAL